MTKVLTIRLSQAELAEIDAAVSAEQAGDRSKWARRVLVQAARPAKEMKGLWEDHFRWVEKHGRKLAQADLSHIRNR